MSFPARPYRAKSKRSRKTGKMNKTERSYARILDAMKLAGEILQHDYEPERLRLADNTYYVPDFRVIMADKSIEFHEVKACKKNGDFLCEDDARAKFKIAAETHWMYGWRMVGMLNGSIALEERLGCEVES